MCPCGRVARGMLYSSECSVLLLFGACFPFIVYPKIYLTMRGQPNKKSTSPGKREKAATKKNPPNGKHRIGERKNLLRLVHSVLTQHSDVRLWSLCALSRAFHFHMWNFDFSVFITDTQKGERHGHRTLFFSAVLSRPHFFSRFILLR